MSGGNRLLVFGGWAWLLGLSMLHFASFARYSPFGKGMAPVVLGVSVLLTLLAWCSISKEPGDEFRFRRVISRGGCAFTVLIGYVVAAGAYTVTAETRPWQPHVYTRISTMFGIAVAWWPMYVLTAGPDCRNAAQKKNAADESK